MIARAITADVLWRHRDDSLRAIAARCGCSLHAAWKAAKREGFQRSAQGHVTHAPCAGCGTQMLRAELDDERRCKRCAAGPELSVVQREFDRYVERMASRGITVRTGYVSRGDSPEWIPLQVRLP